VDEPELFDVDVKRQAPGHLAWNTDRVARDMPELLDDVEQLIAKNFESDLFSSPAQIEREAHERIERVISTHRVIDASSTPIAKPVDGNHPFS
jgi:hypothetical protein